MTGRPRKINPNGATKAVTVILAQETYEALRGQATEKNATIGDIIRQALNNAVKVGG